MIINGVIDWKEGAPEQIKPGMFLSINGGMYLVGDILPPFKSVAGDIAAHGTFVPMHALKWIEAMQVAHRKGFITRLRRPEEDDDTIPFESLLSGTGATLAPNEPPTPMNISDEITSFLLNSEYQYVNDPSQRYRIVALAKAAGELKGSKFIITYQNIETGKVYSRSEADFFEMMINVPPKVWNNHEEVQ